MINKEAAPKGRRVRVSLMAPNGHQVGHLVTDAIFNAVAQNPLTVTVETECPCCGNWSKIMDTPVPNWGPDY